MKDFFQQLDQAGRVPVETPLQVLAAIEEALDDEVYAQMKRDGFDAPDDAEYNVNIKVGLLRRITRCLNAGEAK